MRETRGGIVPFSAACLAKFARDTVGVEVDRPSGVAAITAALNGEELRAVFIAHQDAAKTRIRFAFDFVLDVVNNDELGHEIGTNPERERILRVRWRDQDARQHRFWMPKLLLAVRRVGQRIVRVTRRAQRRFVRGRQQQVIGPVEDQRSGFVPHPRRQSARKTVALGKRFDPAKNETLRLVTKRPFESFLRRGRRWSFVKRCCRHKSSWIGYTVALPSPAPNWMPWASGSSRAKLIVLVWR